MPIHEKSLIRAEDLSVRPSLTIDGVDVSGHWSTFISPRVVTDYNERLEDEIAAMPGGDKIHRCWQCGSCTNACSINAIEPRFNPRYWIYLIRMGYESELLRDKDIIWQCVSCHKCTSICPRDVEPEGVMKATAHWLQLKGFTPPSLPHIFDEEFTRQVVARGRIEDTELVHKFFRRTHQPLLQDWVLAIVRSIAVRLPVLWGLRMAWAQIFKPRTRGWAGSRAAIEEYIHEVEAERRSAITSTHSSGNDSR